MTRKNRSSPVRQWGIILILLLLSFLVECTWSMPFGHHNNNNNHGKPTSSSSSSSKRNRRRGGSNTGNGGNGNGDDGNGNVVSKLQVFCHGEWYQLEQTVTTMADVLEQLPSLAKKNRNKNSNDSNDELLLTPEKLAKAALLCRGKMLVHRTDSLKEASVQDGDTVFVIMDQYQFRPLETLAVLLEVMGSNDDEATTGSGSNKANNKGTTSSWGKIFAEWQEQGGTELLQWWLGSILSPSSNSKAAVHRDRMTQWIRSTIDVAYHRLRMYWERPSFRQALHNTQGVAAAEAYRQVLVQHLPASIQQQLSPDTKKVLQSPQAWREQILRATEGLFQLGDLVLDGLLDIVLDVVQGAGAGGGRNASPSSSSSSSSSSFASQYYASSRSSSASHANQQQQQQQQQPNLEDPSIANQMLFELSESEED